MKFSLIDNNNVIIEIIEADYYERAKKHKSYNEKYILIPSEKEHVKGLDLNKYIPMTTREKIVKGLIKLNPNQVFDDKNDCIITLMPNQQYKNGAVITLTPLEQYQKGIITEEEYLSQVGNSREQAYKENTDVKVIELIRSYLNNNKDKLTKEEQVILKEINNKVEVIKKENPKTL